MAEEPRPVAVLVAALGGQGGGVLTEWLVAAAGHAGLPVQATSIPGVAQRTGATTYYVEIFPAPPAALPAEPVFSLYPVPGDVDVIVASEWLEAGRTLEMDYASPERTLLVASTHRLFAIGEKTDGGGGVFPAERIHEAARALARRVIAFDALAAARQAGSEVNAVLLGALAESGALPFDPACCEAAIREGVAAERNLAGFRAGREIVGLGRGLAPAGPPPPPAWAERRPARAAALGRRGPGFLALCARMEAEFPPALHATLGEALARLVDYQDAAYAARLLERVRPLRERGLPDDLVEAFARRLALWMSYEDAVRVADLKTRPGRFERIRREQGLGPADLLEVTDYLKPDLDELYGLLPARLAAPIARWAERRWPAGRPTLAQHPRTTTVLGFLRLWLLGRCRWLRPGSLRARREWALIERWERAVLDCAARDPELAREAIELARVVRGYGEVRRRLAAAFTRALDEILPAALARDAAAGGGAERARAALAEARRLLLAEEKGADEALAALARG
jgi:indolepyruvate ferredoxin oxidoreductase beta subunit